MQSSTASATGLPVVCWSREATALGNAAAQLRSLGEIDSVEQIWEVVAASTETRSFEPLPSSRWNDAATGFAYPGISKAARWWRFFLTFAPNRSTCRS